MDKTEGWEYVLDGGFVICRQASARSPGWGDAARGVGEALLIEAIRREVALERV